MGKDVFHKSLFINLLWPAVAGNVIWSFFDLLHNAIYLKESVIDICSRLILLIILFIYLIIVWHFSPALGNHKRIWIAEGVHYLTIVPFAIAISRGVESLEIYVFVIYGWTAFAHIIGLWNKDSKLLRYTFGSISVFGLSMLIFILNFPIISLLNGLSLIFVVILAIWLLVRRKLKKNVKKEDTSLNFKAKIILYFIFSLFLISIITHIVKLLGFF